MWEGKHDGWTGEKLVYMLSRVCMYDSSQIRPLSRLPFCVEHARWDDGVAPSDL